MKSTASSNKCELCHKKARIYCSSESAFLCCDCDIQVHTANFLVARHIRLPLFNSSIIDDASSSSSSSSSSTYSVKTSAIKNWKTRNVLVNWCARLGVNSTSVIEVVMNNIGSTDRVGLAASLWFGLLRLLFTTDNKTLRMLRMRTLLKKLEEISGVPAKSIVLAHSRLMSKTRQTRSILDEESSDEC